MKITSILLLLYLLINFVARIIPFGGCSHCLQASQLIQGAYRLTSFSRHFRVIRKIIFYINRALFLLSVLRVAWISFINMVYFFFSFLFFYTLCCFNAPVFANLVVKSFGRFGCFDLRLTFIDAVSCYVAVVDHIIVHLKNTYFKRYRLI